MAIVQALAAPAKKVTIFYSYADEDKEWRKRLEDHLSIHRDAITIEGLHRDKISPGTAWENVMEGYLRQANIILLLLSADYLALQRPHSTEVQRIIELHRNKISQDMVSNITPHIIPILGRPCIWEYTPFANLQILPRNRVAVSTWKDPDEVLRQVTYEIDKIIQGFNLPSDDSQTDELEEPKQTYKPKTPTPFFTGREALLKLIHGKFTRPKTTALTYNQAIYGLPGIGKTQLALKYMHIYSTFYTYKFWVNADSREALVNGYVEYAQGLSLPEQNEKDHLKIVQAFKGWLEIHADWLLILDNADDLTMLQEFIPDTINGHLLLTTRLQTVLPIAERVEIKNMDPEEGAIFLLRRAEKIPLDGSMNDTDSINQKNAREIVKQLGGLPLALDQAGGYILGAEEDLGQYLQLYQGKEAEWLNSNNKASHLAPVAATFLLAFNKVAEKNPIAANALRLCAFLAPDDIPENAVTAYLSTISVRTANSPAPQSQARKGWFQNPFSRQPPSQPQEEPPKPSETDIRLLFNEVCEMLRKFSLIHRNSRAATITVHRLVQAVLKHNMDQNTQRQWAERAVRAVNATFPTIELYKADIKTWPNCENLLSQVSVCTSFIQEYQFSFPEASRLLNDTATYLTERAQYREAEPLIQQALLIRKANGGLLYAQSLHVQAKLDERRANYQKAEQHLSEALEMRKQILGENHADVAIIMSSLAELYDIQGKSDKANAYYERALQINQLNFKPDDFYISQGFNRLTASYLKQKNYQKTEELYRTALDISERKLGGNHPHTAKLFHDRGKFYKDQGKLNEAEESYKHALEIQEHVPGQGSKNPDAATTIQSIAELYELQGKIDEAEQLYLQSLSIRQDVLGRDHHDIATSKHCLAKLYRKQGKDREAEQYYKQALSIRSKKLGPAHPMTIETQRELADFYKGQQRFAEAEHLYQQGLANHYRKLRPDDPIIRQDLHDLVDLYILLGKSEEIEKLYQEAFKQCANRLGINHPSTERSLRELLQRYQGQDEKIVQLYQDTFDMRARKLRGDDKISLEKFEQNLQELSDIYDQRHQKKAKERLYIEAYRVCTRVLGENDRLARYCYDEWMKIGESSGNGETMGQVIKGKLETRILEVTDDIPESIDLYKQSEDDLAGYYRKMRQLEEEEQTYEQGLRTFYQKLGLNHPRTIQSRHDLVKLYESHNKPEEAERIYREALAICKLKLKPESPQVIESGNDLVSCYLRHNKINKETISLCDEQVQFCEYKLKERSFPKAYTLAIVNSLANAASLQKKRYRERRQWKIAESWFQRALQISEGRLGKDHPTTIEIRKNYADLLREMGRHDEAAALEIDPTTMDEAGGSGEEDDTSEEGL